MEIDAKWSKPIRLTDGSKKNLIYTFSLEALPEETGCYIFYNVHGTSFSVLYIGLAKNLKQRLGQQQNNVKLMMGIKNNNNGKKHLIYCTIKYKQGQNQNKVLRIVENNLIKTALLKGHDLLNIQGTKNKYNHLVFSGNRHSEQMFGRKINITK